MMVLKEVILLLSTFDLFLFQLNATTSIKQLLHFLHSWSALRIARNLSPR